MATALPFRTSRCRRVADWVLACLSVEGEETFRELNLPEHIDCFWCGQAGKHDYVRLHFSLQEKFTSKDHEPGQSYTLWVENLLGWILSGGRRWKRRWTRRVSSELHPWLSMRPCLHGHRNHSYLGHPSKARCVEPREALPPSPVSLSQPSLSVESLCICSILLLLSANLIFILHPKSQSSNLIGLADFPLGSWVLYARPPVAGGANQWPRLLVCWEEAWCEDGAASELWEQ